MVYQASDMINSGFFSLDTGDMKTKILSTLVSFAPFVGDTLSSTVTSLGEFLQTREMKKNARKIKTLAQDVVGLNQLTGELVHKLVSDADKQKEIINITQEHLEEIPVNLIDKVKKLFSEIGEKVDSYLHGEIQTSPQAKLGHNDANRLIDYWLRGTTTLETLDDKILDILPVILKNNNNKGNTMVQNTTQKRTSCCELFAISVIRYDNPLLNEHDFLKRYLSNFGTRALNSLINASSNLNPKPQE